MSGIGTETVGPAPEPMSVEPSPGPAPEPMSVEPAPAVAEKEVALDFVARGLDAKSKGNELFKAGKNEEAVAAYAVGLDIMKEWDARPPPPKEDSDDEDEVVKNVELDECRVTLRLNSAMALLKLGRFAEAAEHCTVALDTQSENVKALYRRGFARSRLGQIEGASVDLTRAVKLEPTNREAKRELAALKERLQSKRQAEKALFSGALAKASREGLYSDLEAEKRRKKEADEADQRRKQARFDEFNAARAEAGVEALDLDAWEKVDAEEVKKQEAAATAEAERVERARDEARRRERLARQGEDKVILDDDDDDDLLSDCRGYKTLADGTKTSYFTQVPDEDTAALLTAQLAPKRLESDPNNDASVGASSSENESSGLNPDTMLRSESSSVSAWNAGGATYEERSQTKWVDEALRRHLEATKAADAGVEVKVTKVKKLAGEASIVVSRGKCRYIFDYASTLEWEATLPSAAAAAPDDDGDDDDDAPRKKVRGSLSLPELSSTVTDGLYDQHLKRKSAAVDLDDAEEALVGNALKALQAATNASVANFVDEYAQRALM